VQKIKTYTGVPISKHTRYTSSTPSAYHFSEFNMWLKIYFTNIFLCTYVYSSLWF